MSGNTQHGTNWSDEPFSAKERDTLSRDRFVESVTSRIQQAELTDPSTVFGLVGEWGCGKTSILSRVRDGLGDGWLVGDFSPWSSGDSSAMAVQFVSSLASVLGVEGEGQRAQLMRYANFATPFLGFIPFAGSAMREIADRAVDEVNTPRPWHVQFKELSKTIQDNGKKVLIVVDDVDRLGGAELLNLLRIVRLLGRFRGVHYLLAYDQDTIEDLLRSSGAVGRSVAFMEKIVQYPFEVPPVPRAAVVRLLRDAIRELISSTQVLLDETGMHRISELISILTPLVRTPRRLVRYRESLLAFAGHVSSAELDLPDYVAVTWLRLNAQRVWAQIPAWYEELRTGKRFVSRKPESLSEEAWIERMSDLPGVTNGSENLEMLSFLFPGVSSGGFGRYSDHPRAFADPAYFGRYLILDIPEDDVRDELVQAAVRELEAGREPESAPDLALIVDGDNEDLAILAINKIVELRRQASTASETLFRFLWQRVVVKKELDEQKWALLSPLYGLLAHEIGLLITTETADSARIISVVGEEESLRLVLGATRRQTNPVHRKAILKEFAEYWIRQLPQRCTELRDSGTLGMAADLIVSGDEKDEIRGLLDGEVSDYESFVSLAMAFVRVEQWTGNGIVYDLGFRDSAFLTLLNPSTRSRFHSEIESEAGSVEYDQRHLPDAAIDDHTRRAFAVDSMRRLFAGENPQE